MVPFSSPFHQLHVQMTVTSMKDFLGADDFVVVAPPLHHWVQFPNDSLLWGRLELLQEVIGFLDVCFAGFFARAR